VLHEKGKKRHGFRVIQMKLQKQGIIMNHKKIIRIKNQYRLFTIIRRKNPYKMIMKKSLEHQTFPNMLNREFTQATPGKVLCTDITYIPFKQKNLYLSAVKDLAAGEIVSWRTDHTLQIGFVLDTMKLLKGKFIPNQTILHSDQGVHYTSPIYTKLVKKMRIKQSMSGKGNCIDNASMESFFGHMKDEIDLKDCKQNTDVINEINRYMKYYNTEREQWGKGKMTPAEYRSHLLKTV
jgi:putative transposase